MIAKSVPKYFPTIYRIEGCFSNSTHHRYLRCLATRKLQSYATQSSLSSQPQAPRKQVTVLSDDGRVQWKDLSIREKAARTTQQTFNIGIVLAGLLMTVDLLDE